MKYGSLILIILFLMIVPKKVFMLDFYVDRKSTYLQDLFLLGHYKEIL